MLPVVRTIGLLRPVAKTLTRRYFMNPSNLDNLVSAVSKQYETAIGSGDAFFYESQVSVAKTDDVKNVVPWQIRNVPALLKKPKVVSDDQKTDKPQQNKADVFAPPYVPNLLVKELDDFTLLVRKYHSHAS